MGYEWLDRYTKHMDVTLEKKDLMNFFDKIKKCGNGNVPDIHIVISQEMVDQMVKDLGYEYTRAWVDGDIDKCISLVKSEEE